MGKKQHSMLLLLSRSSTFSLHISKRPTLSRLSQARQRYPHTFSSRNLLMTSISPGFISQEIKKAVNGSFGYIREWPANRDPLKKSVSIFILIHHCFHGGSCEELPPFVDYTDD